MGFVHGMDVVSVKGDDEEAQGHNDEQAIDDADIPLHCVIKETLNLEPGMEVKGLEADRDEEDVLTYDEQGVFLANLEGVDVIDSDED